tara:strand:+ start:3410 stop:4003 length:594 start_codon:yes stop_codon:yes gene_type:complete
MKFLFDLGGVFFDWSPRHFFKKVFSTSKEMEFFLLNVCNDEWNLMQDAGRSIANGEKELISKFPQYQKEIKMYYSNHRKMIKGIFPNSIRILKKLKKLGFESYVLSNWSAETFEGMEEEYLFLKLFDGFIISGREKLIKPDRKIYELAIKRFNLNPNNTVFIDDKLDNIKTAVSLGFNTIHLLNPNTIYADIDKYLN